MKEKFNMGHLKGFFLVCFAGTLWSFGALIIRYMVDAGNYQWQYLFYRGLTIATILLIYLMVREGKSFIISFRHSGASELLGACGLVTAFIGFIMIGGIIVLFAIILDGVGTGRVWQMIKTS